MNITNLTTNSVVISPRSILCEIQSVTVDESVYHKIENEALEKVFENIHNDQKLTQEQRKRLEDILSKH